MVLDIGANTGLFTLLACAANQDARAIAFEPLPVAYTRLVDNVGLNRWQDRCKTCNLAVSNTVGEADFHVPFSEIPASASLNPSGFRGFDGTLIKVSVTTIDAAIPVNQPVDLAKIDVEGFEHYVMEGMRRVLADWHPTLFVECNPDGPNQQVEKIARDYGYRFYHLRSPRPVEVDGILPDSSERFRNYMLSIRDAPDDVE